MTDVDTDGPVAAVGGEGDTGGDASADAHGDLLRDHLGAVYRERHDLGDRGAIHRLKTALDTDAGLRAEATLRLGTLDAMAALCEPHGGLEKRCVMSHTHRHGLRKALGIA